MKTSRIFQFLIIASLLLNMGSAPMQQAPSAAKAQNQLAQMAAERPDAMVRVIAQKMDGSQSVETLVASFGGKVTSDLHIINAFTAEMPAQAALKLAQSKAVRWVSMDANLADSGKPAPPAPSDPTNTYLDTLRVRNVWSMGLQGQGVTIAVVDSGISNDNDFYLPNANQTRVLKNNSLNSVSNTVNDIYGHGTHVAGIAAGNGIDSDGKYAGIAPQANLINLKIADGNGMAYESDVVAALQWVYDNKAAYNIRVVNLSLNTTSEQSYNNSPLDAAVEILWFNGIVVVASAGNYSSGGSFNPIKASPANDPFIITVGATDEKGTTKRTDDVWANFSAIGNTSDGFNKPEIHAPGKNIVSVLSKNSPWNTQYPDRVTSNGDYIRLSGTSMSAPMVSGVVALLLQDEPNLTPDQVKYRLINTASWLSGVKYLDAYAAVTGTTTQSANTGIVPSQLLATGPDAVNFTSVGWNSVGWNSVGWNSVGWNSVGWNSVGWNSTFWGP
jgi:serine protease AprX